MPVVPVVVPSVYATITPSIGEPMLDLLRLTFLFAITAVAEIIGCYLPWLVLRQGKPLYLLIPAAIALALFARSEEHTSELQSLMAHLVCRLLLEKKTYIHTKSYNSTITTH